MNLLPLKLNYYFLKRQVCWQAKFDAQHMEYCAAANVLPHNAVAEQQTLLKWQQSQHAICLMSAHVLTSCLYASSSAKYRAKLKH